MPQSRAAHNVRVDWAALRQAAAQVAAEAYAPYSGLHVGAAGLTDDGEIVSGCNVENASYGLSLCAECGMVSTMVASGRQRLVAVCTLGGRPGEKVRFLAPCGRCRQLLIEMGGPEILLDGPQGPRPLGELLPDAFMPDDL